MLVSKTEATGGVAIGQGGKLVVLKRGGEGLWHLALALGECGLLCWWMGKPPTWFRAREDLSSGQEDSVEQGRDCGEREIPPSRVLSEGGVVVGRKSLCLAFRVREGLVEGGGWQVVGRQSLPLAFRARVVVVVGANLLRHSNREWEGPGW